MPDWTKVLALVLLTAQVSSASGFAEELKVTAHPKVVVPVTDVRFGSKAIVCN
jgi:hypothetical protein